MYEYTQNQEWSLQASSDGLVRWVEKRAGPGWWHVLVLSSDDAASSKSRMDTACGIALEPGITHVVRVIEPAPDDMVCDFCIEEKNATPSNES